MKEEIEAILYDEFDVHRASLRIHNLCIQKQVEMLEKLLEGKYVDSDSQDDPDEYYWTYSVSADAIEKLIQTLKKEMV